MLTCEVEAPGDICCCCNICVLTSTFGKAVIDCEVLELVADDDVVKSADATCEEVWDALLFGIFMGAVVLEPETDDDDAGFDGVLLPPNIKGGAKFIKFSEMR